LKEFELNFRKFEAQFTECVSNRMAVGSRLSRFASHPVCVSPRQPSPGCETWGGGTAMGDGNSIVVRLMLQRSIAENAVIPGVLAKDPASKFAAGSFASRLGMTVLLNSGTPGKSAHPPGMSVCGATMRVRRPTGS
jgi:hypothetical protein